VDGKKAGCIDDGADAAADVASEDEASFDAGAPVQAIHNRYHKKSGPNFFNTIPPRNYPDSGAVWIIPSDFIEF
jgi:hypothetical protein